MDSVDGYLPAIPRYQRPVEPGVVLRAIHGWRPVPGHVRRYLVRRLLVVGVLVGAVHGAAEVRALAGIQRGVGRFDQRRDGDVGSADRRAVELRAARPARAAVHRRLLQRLHRSGRRLPRYAALVWLRTAL